MDINDVATAVQAPANSSVQLALGRIATATKLEPAELVPELYNPDNREVLNLLRQGTDADTITRAWDRLHSAQVATPEPEPAAAPAVAEPVAQTYTEPAAAAPAPEPVAQEEEHPKVIIQADELILGKALSILEQAIADIKQLAEGVTN